MNWKQFLAESRKFLIALLAALAVLATSLTDNVLTTSEWIQVAIAFIGALGVYSIPNGDKQD
jgi:uncharacterized membrane protein